MTTPMRAYYERIEADGSLLFTAATEGVKRDGLDIRMEGGQLESYRANPLLLWCHDYAGTHLPIGKVTDIHVEGGNLKARAIFDAGDPFAMEVKRKYENGFLNAVSIGWSTLKAEGQRVVEWELLDISAVPIPGDASALMERQARALSDLGKSLINLAEPEKEDTETVTAPSGSAVWRGIAAAMAGLFLDYGEMKDDERRPLYNFLERAYRKLGLHAPEFLGRQELDALGMAEVRGLFLADEPALLPGLFERKGAVLNSRNQADLTQAMTLIQGVLDSAKKEESVPLTETSQQSMTENLINLRLILAQLE